MLSRILNKFASARHQKSASPPCSAPSNNPVTSLDGQASVAPIPAVPSWNPNDVILDRYRVEKVMSGSMGKVYISEHLGWGVKMAIKAPRPEVLADKEGMKRILREANSWIRMGMHPNVATCYYVLSLNKVPHLFIEYVDGGSLTDWLETGRCRNLRTALTLAIQFCHGMEYTHSKGIIHRDIKPHNILITKNSLLKITDFGILLSTSSSGEEDSGKLLDSGNKTDENATIGFRGTPGYASPEQFHNTHNVDQRTDIYSFGLCLWMMVCGKKPFKNNAQQNPIPQPAPVAANTVFPKELVDTLIKCVAYKPEDRFQSFAELRTALNQAYLAAFRSTCPYAELSNIDLRADSLNNRAVSLFELGEVDEAAKSLEQTLEINDLLPEAIYNNILLKWRSGRVRPSRLLRQIEAVKQRLPKTDWLGNLKSELKKDLLDKSTDGSSKKRDQYPEFRLCIPKNSLEVFREGQIFLSVQRSIMDHLVHKRYDACYGVLSAAWSNNGFKKNALFNKAYEQLLNVGNKGQVVGAQRFITLKGSGKPATCLAYVPDSRKIVSAGPDGKIVFRDFGANRKIIILGNKDLPVRSMAVCPLGKNLASGTDDGSVNLHSTKSGQLLSSELRHRGPVTALCFNSDGRYLASGGADGILKIRKLSTGPETSVSIQEGGAIRSIVFLNKKLDLVTGSEDGSIRFWENGGKECVRILEAHALPVTALSASQDGTKFVSAGAERIIKIWETRSGRCLKTIKAHDEAISSVLLLADNRTIVSGCEDDTMKLWDIDAGLGVLTLDGRGDGIFSLAQGPKPHTFLAGRKDGAVVLWMIIYDLQFD